jgi:aminopeptidase
MPDGEIFTGPVEDSVNGWVRFTYPLVAFGREVEDVELRFEAGRVVAASAKKNEDFLLNALDTDSGARYLGEFAFGTNTGIQRFTRSTLFDEKIGGTLHMALGAGFPDTGSRNRSGLHWDLICDMRAGGEVWVDGELFYQSGQFKV